MRQTTLGDLPQLTLRLIPLVEIRCWSRARYAIDQEMPCSLFQILLIFVNLLGRSGHKPN